MNRGRYVQRAYSGGCGGGLGAVNELYCEFHVLELARGRLGVTKPYAAPVSKTDLT